MKENFELSIFYHLGLESAEYELYGLVDLNTLLFFFFLFYFLDFGILGFLASKKVREMAEESKCVFFFVCVGFLCFLGNQTECSGFITWECYCWQFLILGFPFEQPWN